jgi:hypothetical protein
MENSWSFLTADNPWFVVLNLDWVLILGNLRSPASFSQWISFFLSQWKAIKSRHLLPTGCTGTYVESENSGCRPTISGWHVTPSLLQQAPGRGSQVSHFSFTLTDAICSTQLLALVVKRVAAVTSKPQTSSPFFCRAQ